MTPLVLAIVLVDGKDGVRKALVVERRLKVAKEKNFIVLLYIFLEFFRLLWTDSRIVTFMFSVTRDRQIDRSLSSLIWRLCVFGLRCVLI
jgi:hypothetical protein